MAGMTLTNGRIVDELAHECQIRDAYKRHLLSERPREKFIAKEVTYTLSSVRADMRTLDSDGIIREWEFKKKATVTSIGQILNYVRLAREEYDFKRRVRGVIAALDFDKDLFRTIEMMNLGIELVQIPPWMYRGGMLPIALDEDPGFSMPEE